ncbi:MAG: hypothetical protein ACJ8KU_10060, partial [Chthoniobacterales bacterium]
MRSRFGRMSWAAFTAAAFCLLAISSPAYFLEGPKWFQSSVLMHLQFPSPPFVLSDGSLDYYKSFENAMALWNEQLATFQLSYVEEP